MSDKSTARKEVNQFWDAKMYGDGSGKLVTPPVANNQTCATCRFHENHMPEQTAIGLCKRRAPSLAANDFLNLSTAIWPTVHKDNWCGEHEMKEPTK